MTQSKAALKAKAKYNKTKTRTYCLRLNLETDKELIKILESVTNKQGYIKDLIRFDRWIIDEYLKDDEYLKEM